EDQAVASAPAAPGAAWVLVRATLGLLRNAPPVPKGSENPPCGLGKARPAWVGGRPEKNVSANPLVTVKPVVLAVSGQIASGKSTLAFRLAEKLNCARASFGDHVRTVAG